MSSPTPQPDPPKRRGRLPGTKNGPNAGKKPGGRPVGRPRKDTTYMSSSWLSATQKPKKPLVVAAAIANSSRDSENSARECTSEPNDLAGAPSFPSVQAVSAPPPIPGNNNTNEDRPLGLNISGTNWCKPKDTTDKLTPLTAITALSTLPSSLSTPVTNTSPLLNLASSSDSVCNDVYDTCVNFATAELTAADFPVDNNEIISPAVAPAVEDLGDIGCEELQSLDELLNRSPVDVENSEEPIVADVADDKDLDNNSEDTGNNAEQPIHGSPTCYDSGSFEMNPPSPVFATHNVVQIVPSTFYKARFFIWLPHTLGRIPCPECKEAGWYGEKGRPVLLQKLGWPQGPRRVVDVNNILFIIGFRYRCGRPECKRTYLSWSPTILNVLSPFLASSFKFHLTSRCALSDQLAGLLRHCFQRGIGPSPFSDMIRKLHVRHYEQRQLEYLQAVSLRMSSGLFMFTVSFQRFRAWDDPSGYAGFVPSPSFFAGFYNYLIEKHTIAMDQHMSMLSARILSVDHSHKVPKHLGKVNGKSVCGALHSTVHEFNELRGVVLTPNKAHDQFMPILAEIPHSLRLYGHDGVELIFTDNVRADKAELEHAIPSLKSNIDPVLPVSTLAPLEIPDGWTVFDLESDYRMRNFMNTVMEDLQVLPEHATLTLAMDMEWSVNCSAGMIHRKVAILSVAYLNSIYLLHMTPYLRDDGRLQLPPVLLSILRSPRIKKTGVNIKGDLTQLFHDCGYSSKDIPFSGAIKLGSLAKACSLCACANISLVNLTTRVLRRHLHKDKSIRVSTQWDSPALPNEYQAYAALDVYAAWVLYQALARNPSNSSVTAATPPGTTVRLLSRDRTSTAAIGFIAPDQPKQFHLVNVSRTRVVLNITSVIQPGYLVRAELLSTKKETSLSEVISSQSLGLLCRMADLEITTGHPDSFTPNQSAPLPECPFAPTELGPNSLSPLDDEHDLDLFDPTDNSYTEVDGPPAHEPSVAECSIDPAGIARAESILSETARAVVLNEPVVWSRVLGDIWHAMDHTREPKTHGMHIPYKRALRDAIFLPDPNDRAAVEQVLAKRQITWETMVTWKPKWVWQRVQRLLPTITILHEQVGNVFRTYGPMKDAKTQRPLFNNDAWDRAKNVLENISLGYYSDPPGISLYM
ncbi:hypothetical protein BC835DRAFT_1311178, partial [Cytidiella melzeri]